MKKNRRGYILISLLLFSCSSPLIKTDPSELADTSAVTLTCNAEKGNQGLKDYKGPVFVHLGLITDSSETSNHWRYVKFTWGSLNDSAKASPAGKNKWTYTIPHIRKFFNANEKEKIFKLAVLFRSGNCIDTFCKVLRNEDKSNILIPVNSFK